MPVHLSEQLFFAVLIVVLLFGATCTRPVRATSVTTVGLERKIPSSYQVPKNVQSMRSDSDQIRLPYRYRRDMTGASAEANNLSVQECTREGCTNEVNSSTVLKGMEVSVTSHLKLFRSSSLGAPPCPQRWDRCVSGPSLVGKLSKKQCRTRAGRLTAYLGCLFITQLKWLGPSVVPQEAEILFRS